MKGVLMVPAVCLILAAGWLVLYPAESPTPYCFDNFVRRDTEHDLSVRHTDGRVREVPAETLPVGMGLPEKRADVLDGFSGAGSYLTSGEATDGGDDFIPEELGGMSHRKAVAAHGRALYMTRCAVCHGGGGDGTGSMARYETYPGIADFKAEKYEAYSPGKMFRSIRRGQGNMPPFGSELTVRDMWSIIVAIRQMQATPSSINAHEL